MSFGFFLPPFTMQSTIFTSNQFQLLRSGEQYFTRLIELIETAAHTIHIQVYIFDWDETGYKVIEALRNASARGVAIWLVVDAYASPAFTNARVAELQQYGWHVKRFAPFRIHTFKIGRRMHHKIVLIDGQTALIGGINIANKYSGFAHSNTWLDVAAQVTGPVCNAVEAICKNSWPRRMRKRLKHNPPTFDSKMPTKIRLIQNDWWRRKIEISRSYRNAIRKSQNDLILVASYFLPSYRKRRLLQKATERGVFVTLIVGRLSDVPFIRAAQYYLYTILLKQGIRIYEWKQSVLHAKFAVADAKWVTIGSYNLNALSDYGSLELNVEIMDEKVNQDTHAFIQSIIAEGCEQVDAESFKGSFNLLKQLYWWGCYQLLRFSLFLLFAFMKRDRLK